MPTLWTTALMFFISRIIVAMEFAVQETLMMRLLPDKLRGRVLTTDRAAEILVTSISTAFAAWSLHAITPQTLTIVSGLLSASPGLIWLALFTAGKLRMPAQFERKDEPEEEEALLASTG